MSEEDKDKQDTFLLDQVKRIWYVLGRPTQEVTKLNLRKKMAELRVLRRSEAWREESKKYSSTSLINEEMWPLIEQVDMEK